jgi:glycosyltransferase involved in cell wall biosynthesis
MTDSTSQRPASATPLAAGLVRAPVELPEHARKGVWIVVAACDEEAVVGEVIRELTAYFDNVIVVDDGSRDETAERASAAGAWVLRHVVNRGQGAALQTGIAYALRRGAEALVTFDADGQHTAADLPYLVEPILSGRADFVLGTRFLGNADAVPLGRRALLGAGVLFTWLTSGLRLSDTHNGMRAFSRRAAEQIDLRLDRMAHASELIDQVRRSGLPYTEVPVRIRYTPYSRSKGQRSSAALGIVFDYLVGKILR